LAKNVMTFLRCKNSRHSFYGTTTKQDRICACKSRTFWQEFTLQNQGAAYARNTVLLTTELATPVLYVVKQPVETASV
jgi:hypothetical protein